MLYNYIKIAVRNLSYSSLINMLGLSAGLAVSVYLFIYINQQLSFDDFHTNSSKIYRVLNEIDHSTGTLYTKEISTQQAFTIDKSLPFIEHSTNISREAQVVVEVDNSSFYEENFYRADTNFFKVFNFELEQGNAVEALHAHDQIIVSSKIAKKYFGDRSPLGEVITVSSKPYRIEGVMKTTGLNSHLNIDLLGVNDYISSNNNLWLTKYFVSTSSAKKVMEKQINDLFTEGLDKPTRFTIQALPDIHLYSNPELSDFTTNGNVEFLYVLGSIALLILITVSFNYTNLSLAKYLKRTKEVGMRKIQGASRPQVIFQLLSETFMIVFLALLLGGVLLEFTLQYLNNWIQYDVILSYNNPEVYLVFMLILIVVTLSAGLYPAYYITSFSPRSMLLSDSPKQHSKIGLIKLLVAAQFVISTILLTATVIMQKQMKYLNDKDLGLNPEGILAVNTENKISALQYESFKNELLSIPGVTQVAAGSMPDRTFSTSIKNGHGESFDINITYILDNYVDLLNIEILSGRNFDIDNPADKGYKVILNEEALELLRLPEKGIGQHFSYQELDLTTFTSVEKTVEVIGIARDFHYRNLKDRIEPLFLVVSDSKGLKDQIGIRYNSHNTAVLLDQVAYAWKGLDTQMPFSYSFLTDEYDLFNRSENRLASGFTYISYLAILLSALGLFGLSNLEAKGSHKTISIKKVLGASTFLLLKQYLQSYLILSLGAGIIGLSIAWWFVNEWLQLFSYKFEINALTIMLPILAITLIAMLSVFFNLQNAASVNPAENLRKE